MLMFKIKILMDHKTRRPLKLKSDILDDQNISFQATQRYDMEGDDHIMTSIETPMLPHAFEMSDDEK